MAVNWNTPSKSARMIAGLNQIDANAAPAKIEIGTSGMAAVLVTITLSDPSFTESGGVLTMASAPKSGSATGTGTAALARIKDGGNNDVVTGLTVGMSGSDINLNSVSIASGQTVTLSNFTLTHSP
jgi:hypothetical protein